MGDYVSEQKLSLTSTVLVEFLGTRDTVVVRREDERTQQLVSSGIFAIFFYRD